MNAALAQEEILFCMKPECLAAMPCVEVMNPNEALIISGAERFADYSGYGHGLKFKGAVREETPLIEGVNAIRNHIVAIDAVVNVHDSQWQAEMILRDINKLYAALHSWEEVESIINGKDAVHSEQNFATGHWGCGAFGGDKQLKAIQQWIALSACRIGVHYYPFGDAKFSAAFEQLTTAVKNSKTEISVGLLTEWLLKAISRSKRDIFNQILSFIREAEAGADELKNVDEPETPAPSTAESTTSEPDLPQVDSPPKPTDNPVEF